MFIEATLIFNMLSKKLHRLLFLPSEAFERCAEPSSTSQRGLGEATLTSPHPPTHAQRSLEKLPLPPLTSQRRQKQPR